MPCLARGVAVVVLFVSAGCDGPPAVSSAPPAAPQAAANDFVTTSTPPSAPAPASTPKAAPTPAPSSNLFSGTFQGGLNGARALITLEQDGDVVRGRMDKIPVSGTVHGDTASGPLVDPESGMEAGTFEITAKGSALEVRLVVKDPHSGVTVTLPPIPFQRVSATATRAARPAAPGQRDPSLVGRWRYTSTYVSGSFSVATDQWLILAADGTCSTDANMAGGGADSSFTASGGDAPVGRWRSEGRVLYVSDSPNEEPQALARYYVEDGRMLLTYGNGNKKVWERVD